MQHLLDLLDDFPRWLDQHGHPAYRGRQVRQWLFDKRVVEFGEMTNLPTQLRDELQTAFLIQVTFLLE